MQKLHMISNFPNEQHLVAQVSNELQLHHKMHQACCRFRLSAWREWNRNRVIRQMISLSTTVYSKKYAHGFCFAVLCCGYTLTDFPISFRLISLALWQSNDCPSANKATLLNMDKYLMWIHYERLHNHNKAKHNKTVCIFPGVYCTNSTVNEGGSDPNAAVHRCICLVISRAANRRDAPKRYRDTMVTMVKENNNPRRMSCQT